MTEPANVESSSLTSVQFTVTVDFDAAPRQVWEALVDWKGHEAWIPATRVEVHGDDPTAPGSSFTAWTGVGPLTLEDRMQVSEASWSSDDRTGRCVIDKVGPVLEGRAGFVVAPYEGRTRVEWFEDVTVPRLPRVLSPVAARIGATGFRFAMRRLNRRLARIE